MADPTPSFNVGDIVQLTNTIIGGYDNIREKRMKVRGITFIRELMGTPLIPPQIHYELNIIENNEEYPVSSTVPESHLVIVDRAQGGGLKRRTKQRRINKKYSRKKRSKKKRSKKKRSKKKRSKKKRSKKKR